MSLFQELKNLNICCDSVASLIADYASPIDKNTPALIKFLKKYKVNIRKTLKKEFHDAPALKKVKFFFSVEESKELPDELDVRLCFYIPSLEWTQDFKHIFINKHTGNISMKLISSRGKIKYTFPLGSIHDKRACFRFFHMDENFAAGYIWLDFRDELPANF